MKKIQEIRAWEKKDTDVLREGTENYRSETKIAQAVRPGRFFALLAGFFSYPHLHWQPQPITGADPDDG